MVVLIYSPAGIGPIFLAARQQVVALQLLERVSVAPLRAYLAAMVASVAQQALPFEVAAWRAVIDSTPVTVRTKLNYGCGARE